MNTLVYKILSDNNVLIIYDKGRKVYPYGKVNVLWMEIVLEKSIYHWMEIVKNEKRLQHYFINAIYAIRRTIKKHYERENK